MWPRRVIPMTDGGKLCWIFATSLADSPPASLSVLHKHDIYVDIYRVQLRRRDSRPPHGCGRDLARRYRGCRHCSSRSRGVWSMTTCLRRGRIPRFDSERGRSKPCIHYVSRRYRAGRKHDGRHCGWNPDPSPSQPARLDGPSDTHSVWMCADGDEVEGERHARHFFGRPGPRPGLATPKTHLWLTVEMCASASPMVRQRQGHVVAAVAVVAGGNAGTGRRERERVAWGAKSCMHT